MFVSPAARRGRRALSALSLTVALPAGGRLRERGADPRLYPQLHPPPRRPPCAFSPCPPSHPRPRQPAPTFTPPSTALPTFNTLAAPDQAVLLKPVRRRESIDAARTHFQSRGDAMQQYCLTNTTPEHWWVCTNDDGRVTALTFEGCGGEWGALERASAALRIALSGSGREPADCSAAGVGTAGTPGNLDVAPEPVDGRAQLVSATHRPALLGPVPESIG